jgi:hypothetical protein
MADTGLDGALYELMRHNAKVARQRGDIETAQYWNRFISARSFGRPFRELINGHKIQGRGVQRDAWTSRFREP